MHLRVKNCPKKSKKVHHNCSNKLPVYLVSVTSTNHIAVSHIVRGLMKLFVFLIIHPCSFCHQVNFMLFMNILRILIQKLNPRLIQFNNSSQYR